MEYVPPFGVFGLTGQAVTAGAVRESPTPNQLRTGCCQQLHGVNRSIPECGRRWKGGSVDRWRENRPVSLGLRGVEPTTGAAAAGATRTPAQIESFILELRH